MTKNNIKTFRDLLIWQKSMILVTGIYQISQSFPGEEVYGIVSQMRRCAISIPSNIAEGYGRNSNNEFVRFIRIATGSLFELQTQIELSINLGFLLKDDYDNLYESTRELERMITSFIRKLTASTGV